MYPPGKETRLIVDEEMVRIFRQLEKLEAEGLENYVIPLAIRLQFEFAARRPKSARSNGAGWTSRTGAWCGPTARSAAFQAHERGSLSAAFDGAAPGGLPLRPPSPNDPAKHLTFGEHYGGWCRVLKAAGVPHVGTHGIRHRSTTDIATRACRPKWA